MRRVFECLTYDTVTATCTASAWVERSEFPDLTQEQVFELAGMTALLLATAWCWKELGRFTRK